MSDPKKVELHPAYQWTCDDCGRDNFARSVISEHTTEDIEYLKTQYGGDEEDWQTGHWMTRPEEVTCAHCGASFETEDWEGPSKLPNGEYGE